MDMKNQVHSKFLPWGSSDGKKRRNSFLQAEIFGDKKDKIHFLKSQTAPVGRIHEIQGLKQSRKVQSRVQVQEGTMRKVNGNSADRTGEERKAAQKDLGNKEL